MLFENYEIIILTTLVLFGLIISVISIYKFCKQKIKIKKEKTAKKEKRLRRTNKFIYYSSTSSSNTEDEIEAGHSIQDLDNNINNSFRFIDHIYDPYFTNL